MPARLQGAVKNFVGLSGDLKPVFTDEANTLPLGVNSTFFEKDTWRPWIWDGTAWNAEPAGSLASGLNAAIVAILLKTLDVLREMRDEERALRLGMQGWLDSNEPVTQDIFELSENLRDQPNEEY